MTKLIPDVQKARVEMSTSGKKTVEDACVPFDMEGGESESVRG